MNRRRWGWMLVVGLAIVLVGASQISTPRSAGASPVRTDSPMGEPSHPANLAGEPPIRPLGLLPNASSVNLTFNESGLPPGTVWEISTRTPATGFVLSDHSNGTTIVQSLTNGSYTFTATADLANITTPQVNQTLQVTGASSNVTVRFYLAQPVVFMETGLPARTPWSVLVLGDGTLTNTTGDGGSLRVEVPVGPYNYSFKASGYEATPANGSGTIAASAGRVSVSFQAILPPPGYITGEVNIGSAEVYLNGLRTLVNLGGGFFFTLEPGFYSMIVTATGYAAYYNTTFVTSNSTTTWYITLAGAPSPALPNATTPGIDTEGWLIIGGLSVAVVILVAVTLLYARTAKRAVSRDRGLSGPAREQPPADSDIHPPRA